MVFSGYMPSSGIAGSYGNSNSNSNSSLLRSAFSSCSERGLLFVAVRGLLIVVASLAAEHRLKSAGSVVVAHRLSCSAACGIFPDQGLNPCLLHWQAGS